MDFRKTKIFSLELLESILLSLIIILPIRFFVIQPFFVKGQSMEPNFHENDYLIIDEISYRFRPPSRGEVIVLRSPIQRDRDYFFIKRIIGLPGETVEIKNNQVIIYSEAFPQGMVLDEPYLGKGVVTEGNLRVTLGPDQYFVLGDNRTASYDSRRWGLLSRRDIVGRVWLRLWPIKSATVFAQ